MSKVKPLRAEHADATRKALLGVARRLFTERGYDATSLDQIAADARVTKGAVYHHFENKRDLFRSLYEELAAEVEARIVRALAEARDPLERARLGVDAFLACADDPAVRTVMFRDGMAVLAGECRVIDDRHYLRLLQALLDELAGMGLLSGLDTALLGRLLLAMLIEASAIVGAADDVDAARARVRPALERVIFGMLRPPG